MTYSIEFPEEPKQKYDPLIELINKYIEIVEGLKKEAERTTDWAEYHKCIGKIGAYKNVIASIVSMK